MKDKPKAVDELIKSLEELQDHSCDIEDAEFGYYTCCNQRDYEGHAKDCDRVNLIDRTIARLKDLDQRGKSDG